MTNPAFIIFAGLTTLYGSALYIKASSPTISINGRSARRIASYACFGLTVISLICAADIVQDVLNFAVAMTCAVGIFGLVIYFRETDRRLRWQDTILSSAALVIFAMIMYTQIN